MNRNLLANDVCHAFLYAGGDLLGDEDAPTSQQGVEYTFGGCSLGSSFRNFLCQVCCVRIMFVGSLSGVLAHLLEERDNRDRQVLSEAKSSLFQMCEAK